MKTMLAALALTASCAPVMAADTSPSPIVAAAREAVLTRLGSAAAASTLEAVAAGRTGHGDARATYKARPIEGPFPRARFTVMVDVYGRAGRLVGSHPVGFALSETGVSLVYRHAEHAGVDAMLVDADTGDVDLARAPDALANLSEAGGKRLRHAVRAGAPVLASDFEPVPDVDVRSVVRLEASYGAITVESPAVAMRAGNRGDKVPVMVHGASGPVTALVVDKGVARIEH